MKVCVVGSDGRGHALGWKASQSPKVEKVYFAGGNGGTSLIGENISVPKLDTREGIRGLVQILRRTGFTNDDLLICSPEGPLFMGLKEESSDYFMMFGPNSSAAKLEESKVHSKDFMRRHRIETPDAVTITRNNQRREVANIVNQKWDSGYTVVKVDGPAAGKGVKVFDPGQKSEGFAYIFKILFDQKEMFGASANKVLLERRVSGDEFSCMFLTDGKSVRLLPFSQDYKDLYPGSSPPEQLKSLYPGPNPPKTGGMGSYSPRKIHAITYNSTINDVILPTLTGLRAERIAYSGALYAGLITDPKGRLYVLEYNVRLGDPETQSILPRIDSDIIPYMVACTNGTLGSTPEFKVSPRFAVTTVLTARGYPDNPEKGKKIEGLKELNRELDTTSLGKDVLVFHAGTILSEGEFYSNGGRILDVTTLAEDAKKSRELNNEIMSRIRVENGYYRTDIALDGELRR